MFGRSRIPDADKLFLKFFDRWYDDDARRHKVFSATRPDLLESPDLVGRTIEDVCPLVPESTSLVDDQIAEMVNAAKMDWPEYLPVQQPIDLSWLEAFDAYYDTARIRRVIADSPPRDSSNDYIVICCECGAVIGHVMQQLQPRLVWCPSLPYWESSLIDFRTGTVIAVFHWAIKKMSNYAVDDGLVAKVQKCIEFLDDSVPAS